MPDYQQMKATAAWITCTLLVALILLGIGGCDFYPSGSGALGGEVFTHNNKMFTSPKPMDAQLHMLTPCNAGNTFLFSRFETWVGIEMRETSASPTFDKFDCFAWSK